jgi:ABC-type nickel/cobalt efflux system permease component RcnA
VIVLGISGGLIPCWDAIALLLFSAASGQMALALPLLLAFSAGLAAVLVALGLVVVWARRRGVERFGESRWVKALPLVSAALLIGMGLWLCREAVHGGG